MRLTIVLDNFIVHDKQSCHSQLLVLNIDQETTHRNKEFIFYISGYLRSLRRVDFLLFIFSTWKELNSLESTC